MIRRPPRSTRTDTLFPYTTLFRSFCYSSFHHGTALSTPSTLRSGLGGALGHLGSQARHHGHRAGEDLPPSCHSRAGPRSLGETHGGQGVTSLPAAPPWARRPRNRSEERPVGKEGVSTCRTR